MDRLLGHVLIIYKWERLLGNTLLIILIDKTSSTYSAHYLRMDILLGYSVYSGNAKPMVEFPARHRFNRILSTVHLLKLDHQGCQMVLSGYNLMLFCPETLLLYCLRLAPSTLLTFFESQN